MKRNRQIYHQKKTIKRSLIQIRAEKALDQVSWKSITALSAYDATMDRETWWKELLKIRQFGYNRNQIIEKDLGRGNYWWVLQISISRYWLLTEIYAGIQLKLLFFFFL